MCFKNWIEKFISEKGIDRSQEYVIEINNEIHIVEFEVLLAYIKELPIDIKNNIKSKIVYIDFKYGNVNDFFEYMAKGYVATFDNNSNYK